jgi:hypothetical protein
MKPLEGFPIPPAATAGLRVQASAEQVSRLMEPSTIRARCREVYRLAEQGRTSFRVYPQRLEEAAHYVLEVTRASYPDGRIPFHARWEHFQAGGVDRLAPFKAKLKNQDAWERTRTLFDLAITSVLLDAGAGPKWKYHETSTDRDFDRSEGLAVASLHLFEAGVLSSDSGNPLRADAQGLEQLTADVLGRVFQVGSENPLTGLDSRTQLLNGLGHACRHHPEYFPAPPGQTPRPGHLADFLRMQAKDGTLPCKEILRALLLAFGHVWPSRIQVGGVPFGDVWHYDPLDGEPRFETLVPFHKLSQWLTYSLVEPLEEAGLKVTGVHELTGLPEYRNGGLFLDLGVLELRDSTQTSRAHRPDSPLIIEWRALTVCLLDDLAALIRKALNQTPEQLPLARILQGGTWAAGRKAAREKRPDGSPPLTLDSDGTVF